MNPLDNGSFGLTLGGETLLFRPDSPAEFSGTSAVPLAEPQAEPLIATPTSETSSASKPATSDETYIDDAFADIRPITDLNDDGGLSRGFVAVMSVAAGVLSIAAVVTAALV